MDYVYENGYKLIYSNENSININLEDDWIIVPAGTSSWNMHAGLNPIILFDQDDGKFIRFQCIRWENNEDGFLSQMSNMTEKTKLLFKKAMDEYPPLEEDTFYGQIQSKNN